MITAGFVPGSERMRSAALSPSSSGMRMSIKTTVADFDYELSALTGDEDGHGRA
ncbi:MAG: hypothetical protein WKF62_07275 [Solirubrobacterales bacterium]